MAKHEIWVQSFTAGVKTLIRGIRTNEKPANNGIDLKNSNDRHSTKRRAKPVTLTTIEKIEEVTVDDLCSKTKQCQSIYLLTQILTFLKEQTKEGVVYHLKREKNSDTKECTISLYQIHNNEQFITKQLLDDVKNIVLN